MSVLFMVRQMSPGQLLTGKKSMQHLSCATNDPRTLPLKLNHNQTNNSWYIAGFEFVDGGGESVYGKQFCVKGWYVVELDFKKILGHFLNISFFSLKICVKFHNLLKFFPKQTRSATWYMLLDICYLLLTTCYLLLANCYLILATCYYQPDTCYFAMGTLSIQD